MISGIERYAEQLSYIGKLQGLARSLATLRPFRALREKICLTVMARATVAAESVCLLFSGGLDGDARSVSRIIAELAIDLGWMLSDSTDDRIRLFVEYIHVLNARREASIQILSRHSGALPDAQKLFDQSGAAAAGFRTPEEFAQFRKNEYERVKLKYKKASHWNAEDLASRARQLGLEVLYETVFRAGSEAGHSGPATMTSLLRDAVDGRPALLMGPAPPEDNSTLLGAAWALLYLIETCVSVLDPSRKTEVKDLAEEFGRLFGS